MLPESKDSSARILFVPGERNPGSKWKAVLNVDLPDSDSNLFETVKLENASLSHSLSSFCCVSRELHNTLEISGLLQRSPVSVLVTANAGLLCHPQSHSKLNYFLLFR